MDEGRLLKQVHAIKAINERKISGPSLSGSEVDILSGGRLDFEDADLEPLDYVVASVHCGLTQDEETMTTVSLSLGASTGDHAWTSQWTLTSEKGGSTMNIQKIIDAALANGKLLSSMPISMRLDMDWRHWRRAAEKAFSAASILMPMPAPL